MAACFVGGDAGGVAGVRPRVEGAGPGEQYGMCLLGMGADWNLVVSRVRVDDMGEGDLDWRRGVCWTTSVAIAVMDQSELVRKHGRKRQGCWWPINGIRVYVEPKADVRVAYSSVLVIMQ